MNHRRHRRSGRRATLGKDRAFSLVLRTHTLTQVEVWLERLGIRRWDLRELAQDVLLDACQRFEGYVPDRTRAEKPWLKRIVSTSRPAVAREHGADEANVDAKPSMRLS